MQEPRVLFEDLHRGYWTSHLDRLEDWPDQLRGIDGPFRLFLALNATELDFEVLVSIARKSIPQGLASLCSWGPDCERVAGAFDVATVDALGDRVSEATIMTTAHSNESLHEALWFFAVVAYPDEAYAPEPRHWFAVTVGNRDWSEQVDQGLKAPDQLFSRLGP